jgi:outer membrane lipoprotein-sorting protein
MQSGYGIVGSEGLMKMANADYDLKVAGTAKIRGMEMDILEGKLKGTAKPGSWTLPTPAKVKYYVGAQDGFIYKMEGLDKAGKLILEISHENLKFNAGVPDKVFSFVPPKGVEVFEATEIAPQVIK